MFDLLRFVSELIFGSSLSISRDIFEYLSSNLNDAITLILQQSFAIALRSKRTRLLGDDFQLALKCRAVSPLYGYCCSSARSVVPSFQTVCQGARILFVQVDASINLNEYPKKCIVRSDDILLHVEWLAIAGQQKLSPMKSSCLNKSIFNVEQQLYLSLLETNDLNENLCRVLSNDQTALNSILAHFVQWCRNNICECLVHSCRLEKRRQLAHYLTIIHCLLHNSSIAMEQYLHILSPIAMTCLLYEFEIDEPRDIGDVDTGDVWSLRLLAAQICVQILRRSHHFVYDIFYTRLISRLVSSLIDPRSPSSTIYAILSVFEQLGPHSSRTFLLPYILEINTSKLLSSESVLRMLERIATIIVE